MSRSGPSLPQFGPAIGDVARLWTHLTTEWVTDLEIKIRPETTEDGGHYMVLSVVSERYTDQAPQGYVYVWAVRRFSALDYKGSYNQLYDLLIVAYRKIEEEFARTERLPAVKAT